MIMDPNEILRALRALAATVLRDHENADGSGVDQDDASALAEHFAALDEWISGGGFLPESWAKGRTP
jgi:hypothetical protein